jgi:hypothetical protein
MERQWFERGPQTASRRSLAHRRERFADGGWVVAIVIKDKDTRNLAFALQSPTHAVERSETGSDLADAEPQGRGGAGDRQSVCGVVPPGGRQPSRHEPGQRVEAKDVHVRRTRIRGRDPAQEHTRGSACRREPLPDAAGIAAQPLRRLVHEGIGHDGARPVRKPFDDAGDTWVTHVGHQRRIGLCATEPLLERVDDGGLVNKDIRMIPIRAGQGGHGGSIRIEVAGVFVRLDDKGRPPPPARRRRLATGQRCGQECSDEG